jgi:aconitate hydratase
MFRPDYTEAPVFTDTLHLDMGTVVPAVSGPKRPQDWIELGNAAKGFAKTMEAEYGKGDELGKSAPVAGEDFVFTNGDVAIAAITSCTNTSNPSVMLGAGLVARNARAKGLTTKPWVKTSLAPGSQVVTDYLERAGLQDDLDALGFDLVGYGCTTCIGNSGPLPPAISKAINENDLVATSVLSGNRNFEGRISPDVRANYLASPPLVVAYAIAGTMTKDLTTEPLGQDQDGNDVYLRDIWPTSAEVAEAVRTAVTPEMFAKRYADVFKGDEAWRSIEVSGGLTYAWDHTSTYVQNPPYFDGMTMEPEAPTDIVGAKIMGLFGDSITTDHISPAGSIKANSPAGRYLQERQVPVLDFNSYGSRRGNHEVMMRGTFANIRIKNKMLDGVEGGYTLKDGQQVDIYDACMAYQAEGTPLVVFGGKEYGTGSSRDWAAKGTRLLGVKAVITESFERIHRSNLIGMGVLPLQFKDGVTWESLGMKGDETVTIRGIEALTPRADMTVEITFPDGTVKEAPVFARIDTENELEYYRDGGILHYVLRNLARG